MTTSQSNQLLYGYRVLDLTDEKGFLCAKILGDLGAEVIKVEKPGGDPSRMVAPFIGRTPDPERSLFWFAYNANKKGITLNLEANEGRDIFKELIRNADFVIESYSPGYLDKLQIGYQDLCDINGRIIMVSISPFGQTGPYRDYKASDLICMGMGGLMNLCGYPDRAPVRIPGEQAYLQAGAQAAASALIAHTHRSVSGRGQLVDVSIQECIVWTLEYVVPYWFANKRLWMRSGAHQTRLNAKIRTSYQCKDGYLTGAVGFGLMLGPMQARLVKLMEDEGMAEDLIKVDWKSLSFESVSQEDIDHWEKAMQNYFRRHTKSEIQDMAVRYGLLFCPVYDAEEITNYAQLRARGFWSTIEHQDLAKTLSYPGPWYKSNKTSCGIRTRAPLIGEHNIEIYSRELGFSEGKLRALSEAGVI